MSAFPKNYITSDRQRLEAYRRIAKLQNAADMRRFEEELKDLFGPPPVSVRMLIEIAELRMYAARWKIKSLIVHGQDLIFTMEAGGFLNRLIRPRPRPGQHHRPPDRLYASGKELFRTQNPHRHFAKTSQTRALS